VADLEAELAGRDIGELEPVVGLARELGAVRAGVADELDQLHLGLGIADAVPALGSLGHHGRPVPVALAAQHERCADERRGLENRSELHPCPCSSGPPRLRASDSSTARSSGSPMSRKLSPSSSGIGLSEGPELSRAARSVPGGGLTSPCRILTFATA